MRIGIVIESSSCSKNQAIQEALEGRGHEIINVGMKTPDEIPSLSYIHTSFIAAFMLHLKTVDFVVGGCGTGQGFTIAVNRYPGAFCGLMSQPLDAWLFNRINAGNAISLPLNQGYGWAGEIQLQFIFDRLFDEEMGGGFPEHRREIQKQARETLLDIADKTQMPFLEIIKQMDPKLLKECAQNEVFYNLVKNADSNCESKQLFLDTVK